MASLTNEAVLASKHLNKSTLIKLQEAGVDTSPYDKAHAAVRGLGPNSKASTVDAARNRLLTEKRELLSKLFKLRAGALEAHVGELQEAASRAAASSSDTTEALEKALELSRKNDANQTNVLAHVEGLADTAIGITELMEGIAMQPNNAPAKRHSETELNEPVAKQRQTEEPGRSQHPDITACRRHCFLNGDRLTQVWDLVRQCQPRVFTKQGSHMKSQPKLVYGCAGADGAMPLFRGNMDKRNWSQIEPMPPSIAEIAQLIGEAFGETPNHCLLNFMPNGRPFYIPAHQDQPCPAGEVGHERTRSVYILALGAERPLISTPLACLGKYKRGQMEVLHEIVSKHGDLFELRGQDNSSMAHCVPQDHEINGLRVSLTFRHVEHSWVRPSTLEWWSAEGDGGKLPLSAEEPPMRIVLEHTPMTKEDETVAQMGQEEPAAHVKEAPSTTQDAGDEAE